MKKIGNYDTDNSSPKHFFYNRVCTSWLKTSVSSNFNTSQALLYANPYNCIFVSSILVPHSNSVTWSSSIASCFWYL